MSGGINPTPTINPTLEKGSLFGAFYQPDHGPQKPLSPEPAPRVTPAPHPIKSETDFPSPGPCVVASSMAQMLRGSDGTPSTIRGSWPMRRVVWDPTTIGISPVPTPSQFAFWPLVVYQGQCGGIIPTKSSLRQVVENPMTIGNVSELHVTASLRACLRIETRQIPSPS